MTSVWNDPQNFRDVVFVVRYRKDNEGAEVVGFEPTEIRFFCEHQKRVKRRVRIHTPKGRSYIANQIRSSGRLNQLVNEIF